MKYLFSNGNSSLLGTENRVHIFTQFSNFENGVKWTTSPFDSIDQKFPMHSNMVSHSVFSRQKLY